MCGLTGFLGGCQLSLNGHSDRILRHMTGAITHRGPDSEGYWRDDDAGIALGHRRLAVVDLSAAGAQPMHAASGRYVLAYNGEIYNHTELRSELKNTGFTSLWRGHADTETLLACFDAWGIKRTLCKCVGMFAIAVWDRKARILTLARDRMGEKPLYYGWQGEGARSIFLFASELGALKKHPSFNTTINRGAMALLMRHNYIPAPHSIYRGTFKLEPGSMLQVSHDDKAPRITRFWDLAALSRQSAKRPFLGSPTEAVDQLEALTLDSTRQQMLADVPVGAFLSGGIDSSAVVALMQAQSPGPVKTFTIGFNESIYNEAGYAKAVAAHLGTDHTELYLTPAQVIETIPLLPKIYCEPFADSSQIPTFLISKLAREHVTVSLSGDGGDELFCGYTRYGIAERWWNRLRYLPEPMRQALKASIAAADGPYLQKLLPRSVTDKFDRGLDMLGGKSLERVYLSVVSNSVEPCEWLTGVASEPPTVLAGLAPDLEGLEAVERMMALDAVSYLPDDILTKVDRASMGVSLECRVPLLDHRIVEFAYQLPLSYKRIHGMSKWPLRQLLYRYVPPELIDRPKRGFAVPLHDWLRGPLRDWAENLVDSKRLHEEGFFNVQKVRDAWQEHSSGRRNWTTALWAVLMFQAWFEEQGR